MDIRRTVLWMIFPSRCCFFGTTGRSITASRRCSAGPRPRLPPPTASNRPPPATTPPLGAERARQCHAVRPDLGGARFGRCRPGPFRGSRGHHRRAAPDLRHDGRPAGARRAAEVPGDRPGRQADGAAGPQRRPELRGADRRGRRARRPELPHAPDAVPRGLDRAPAQRRQPGRRLRRRVRRPESHQDLHAAPWPLRHRRAP